MRWLRACLLVASVALPLGLAAGETPIVAIVNAANPERTLSVAQLRLIYRGQRSHWTGGQRVRIVLPLDRDAAMGFLARRVLGVDSPERVARFYLARVFRQRASNLPPQLSRAAAIAYVSRDPGAIALVAGVPPIESPGVVAIPIAWQSH